MSAAKTSAKIYNIPAGIPFARSLAAQLIAESKGDKTALAATRIFLPTRRAARVLREAFLDETEGAPILLPQMQVLGDIDEEELSLAISGEDTPPSLLDIPPGLPNLKRQVLLARTIQKIPGYAKNFDQALLLAGALGRLMDQIYTENLTLDGLANLVPEDFANHWQITLKFMTILSEVWPKVLAENGMIDSADRRNKLLRALTAHWQKSPPQTPIIAAGTTGSIPATWELLQLIATLPKGRIVLPGLDTDMDAKSWDALDETHPQYGLHLLLQKLGTEREQVAFWPGKPDRDLAEARRILAAEIMRPSQTADSWAADLPINKPLQQKISAATKYLQLLTCSNEREEAAAIAMLLRESLDTKGRTAALITPRRSLARRVAANCRRWGIEIDDSAGQSLDQTIAGSYLRLCVDAAASNIAPVALLALLKHSLSKAKDIQLLDKDLRGARPAPGLEGLKDRDKAGITRFIAPNLERFMGGSTPEKPRKAGEIIEAHLEFAESLSLGPDILWDKDDGEAAARFFDELRQQAHLFPDLSLLAYRDILDNLMKGVTVRPRFGTHPRLQILGQLEARMIDADLIIMAGLNEKSWPPEPGHDPWMSRPMRKQFGLPSAERSIGLAAHDFVQGFCASHVVLTRSLRQEGAPSVPARWLQRLAAVLEAAGLPENTLDTSAAISWAQALDEGGIPQPARRPEPRPPVAARPRSISVTQVEKWQQDPYALYARYVLDLTAMKPLEKPVEAAEKGELLHEILKNFVQEYPTDLPSDTQQKLVSIAAAELTKRHDDPAAWSFWQRRFDKTAGWLAQHETGWRISAKPAAIEITGQIEISAKGGPFTLKARADRIDRMQSGGGAVIDYKSGSDYPPKQILSGKLPQLPLEGLILAQGGFENPGPVAPVSLQYWKLSGGREPGEVQGVFAGVEGAVVKAEAGLKGLIDAFDNEKTPYYSLPRPDNAPRFNDYKHLARISEWAALGDDDSSEAA